MSETRNYPPLLTIKVWKQFPLSNLSPSNFIVKYSHSSLGMPLRSCAWRIAQRDSPSTFPSVRSTVPRNLFVKLVFSRNTFQISHCKKYFLVFIAHLFNICCMFDKSRTLPLRRQSTRSIPLFPSRLSPKRPRDILRGLPCVYWPSLQLAGIAHGYTCSESRILSSIFLQPV